SSSTTSIVLRACTAVTSNRNIACNARAASFLALDRHLSSSAAAVASAVSTAVIERYPLVHVGDAHACAARRQLPSVFQRLPDRLQLARFDAASVILDRDNDRLVHCGRLGGYAYRAAAD